MARTSTARINKFRLLMAVFIVASWPYGTSADDPLPAWNEGKTKRAITSFVRRVVDSKSPDFVEERDRIAVFDNDGTLWAEQPMYFQVAFAIDRIKQLAPAHPGWKKTAPFKFALNDDLKAILDHKNGIRDLIVATHGNVNVSEFTQSVSSWIRTAKHPTTGLKYTEMVYEPMLQLLRYLRVNGFKTYIVSGGATEFIRPWAQEAYGILPEQVIGSSMVTVYDSGLRDDPSSTRPPVLRRKPEIDVFNNEGNKPISIQRQIGRRPIAAFGNSDGDLQMLEWTAAGKGARLALLVHHTDVQREWAYDRNSKIGKLDKALDVAKDRGWVVADMQRDWNYIFIPQHHYLHQQPRPHAAEWGYQGNTGPAHWGDINPAYVLAKTGRHQSPIDITNVASTTMPRLHVNYQRSKIQMIYNGLTIQENEEAGSSFVVGGRKYNLMQFHFHSPSEHTVDGNHFPMEMHLVHKSDHGEISVIAVFIREGKHNKSFDPAWKQLPDENAPTRTDASTIDTSAMLPKNLDYYAYEGSFTTPPCTQRVRWIVLKDPVSLSKEQIAQFRRVIDGNNRPVQPLNGRRIYRSK